MIMVSQKRRLAASLVFVLFLVLLPSASSAQTTGIDLGMVYAGSIGLPLLDIREIAVRVIRAALGFVGLVMVMRILYGGLMMLTHGGSEDGRSEAIEVIKGAVIGVIIIMTSSALVQFIVNAVANTAQTYL
jgi:predicted permease